MKKYTFGVFALLIPFFLNGGEAELIENAKEISSRIVPTQLKYHYLKKIWFKGDEYCLDKPKLGTEKYEGIYIQVLLDKVPENDVCSFSNPGVFKLNTTTKMLN